MSDRNRNLIEIAFPHWNFRVKIKACPFIFAPSRVSTLLAKTLRRMDGQMVLDIGTGSGFLAIVASRLGAALVVATDISTDILQCAGRNAKLNEVSNISFRLGPFYAPVEGMKFNTIICNPPQIPYPEPLNDALWGGRDGKLIINKIIDEASKFLENSGRILLPVLSVNDLDTTKSRLEEKGFKVEPKAEDTQPFGPKMLQLIDYIKTLEKAEIIWIDRIPHWKCVVFQGTKS